MTQRPEYGIMSMDSEIHRPSGGPWKTLLGQLIFQTKKVFLILHAGNICILIWGMMTRAYVFVKNHRPALLKGVYFTDISYMSAMIRIWLQSHDNYARITGIHEL